MTSTLKPAVLLAEDEPDMAEEIRLALEANYAVHLAANEAEILQIARSQPLALMVMDRMLGAYDSLSAIRTLRADGLMTPVIIISALSAVDERIQGLKAGGDDYLIKPFELRELCARAEALARRGAYAPVVCLRAGSLEMDLIKRTVRRHGRIIDLLPREFKLLEYFLRRRGQIVTRAMLLTDVWNYTFIPLTNVVDVHIGNLRRKLEEPGEERLIVNVRGEGFMLHADD